MVGGSQGTRSGVYRQGVLKIDWTFIVYNFKSQKKYFENDTMFYWEPVQLFKNWRNVITALDLANKTGCRVLYGLKFCDVRLWETY